jgi:hypothetical protein
MRSIERAASMVLFLGVVVMAGCGEDNPTDNSGTCQTSVDNITSPAAGAATLHGSFFSTESVIIQESDGTVLGSGTPENNRDAFTLTGIPSGDHTYHIIISCDSGRDDLGGFPFHIL